MSLAVMAAPSSAAWAALVLDRSKGHHCYELGTNKADHVGQRYGEFPADRPYFGFVAAGYLAFDFDHGRDGKSPLEWATEFVRLLEGRGYSPVLVTSGGAGDRCHIWAVVPTQKERHDLLNLAKDFTADIDVRGVLEHSPMRAILSLHREGGTGRIVNVTEAEAWHRLQLPERVEPQEHQAPADPRYANLKTVPMPRDFTEAKKKTAQNVAQFIPHPQSSKFAQRIGKYVEDGNRAPHIYDLAFWAQVENISRDAYIAMVLQSPVGLSKYGSRKRRERVLARIYDYKANTDNGKAWRWEHSSLPLVKPALQGLIREIGHQAREQRTLRPYLSVRGLAMRTRKSKSTVARQLAELRKLGLIRLKEDPGMITKGGTSKQGAHIYELSLKDSGTLSPTGIRGVRYTVSQNLTKDERDSLADAFSGRPKQEAAYLAIREGASTIKEIQAALGAKSTQGVYGVLRDLAKVGAVRKVNPASRGSAWELNPEWSPRDGARGRMTDGNTKRRSKQYKEERARFHSGAWRKRKPDAGDVAASSPLAVPHDQDATRPTPIREHLRRSQGIDDQRRRVPAPAYAGGYVA